MTVRAPLNESNNATELNLNVWCAIELDSLTCCVQFELLVLTGTLWTVTKIQTARRCLYGVKHWPLYYTRRGIFTTGIILNMHVQYVGLKHAVRFEELKHSSILLYISQSHDRFYNTCWNYSYRHILLNDYECITNIHVNPFVAGASSSLFRLQYRKTCWHIFS